MKHLAWISAVAAAALVAAGACSSSDDGDGGAAAGGTGATGGIGGTGGDVGPACDPPCTGDQFCSVAGQCIDNGTCLDDGDCDAGLECDLDTNTCVPGGPCGHEEATAEPVPPNLMIVLDRSCSMRRDLDNVLNPAGPNKWTYAVAAIDQMLTQFNGDIRFGLILFPDTTDPNCQQAAPAFPVAPGNETGISTLLNNALSQSDPNFPDGPCVTNIDTAMEQTAQEPAFNDAERQSFALLITDGKQAACPNNVGDPYTTQIITDLCADGVSTFVVGFGDLTSGTIDPDQLNIWAVAGCVPQTGAATDFYAAETPQQLQQALDAIANATLGCVFQLSEVPEDPDSIFVFFNNLPTQIPRDETHQDGWDYDPNTNQVTFYGPACDQLKDGTVTDVDIVLGCAMPTPD